MKAIILKGAGGVENLVRANIPVPDISDNELLIEVKAIGINPIDVKTRSGKGMYGAIKENNPLILGWDISGVVVQVGPGAGLFSKGDEVFGMINFPGYGKAYAEHVAANERHLALKPSNISHEEAAAASLAALTAWQVIKYKSGINRGDKVLIHAAAGGVGHFAVQMAKHLGAWVAGTSSYANRQFVIDIGADLHIDYRNQKFEDILQDMDFVLDTIGGEYSDRSIKVLKPGGTIICIPSGSCENIEKRASERGVNGSHFRVRSDGENMKEIAGLLENGALKSYVSKIFTFNGIQAAHTLIETGRTRGKIVVVPS